MDAVARDTRRAKLESGRSRANTLPWLLKVIEDLYDARYAHDVAELEYLSGGDPDDADADDLFGAHPSPTSSTPSSGDSTAFVPRREGGGR